MFGVGLATAGALGVVPRGGRGEKIPGGSGNVGVTPVETDAAGVGVVSTGTVEVIPVAGATSDPVGEVGRAASPVIAGAGVLKIVTFWGGGVVSGPNGFSRVHPMATIANNASVAKR